MCRLLLLALAPGCALVSDADLADRLDLDGDGLARPVDCDDADPAVGVTTWFLDEDGDGYGVEDQTTTGCTQPAGYAAVAGDCDDTDPGSSPGLDYYWDGDRDGYGDPALPYPTCDNAPGRSLVTNALDCDDGRADVSPEGTEVCDDGGVDEDCDGLVDDADFVQDPLTWYADRDGDGFGAAADTAAACVAPSGYLANRQDCDDADPAVTTACRWVQVSAGYYHSCARRGDGTVECWGDDDGSHTVLDGTYTDVSAGYQASCGVRVDGSLVCWVTAGDEQDWVLDPPQGMYAQVAVDHNYACALNVAGEITCWGTLPDGDAPPEGTGYSQLTAAEHAACAVGPDGGTVGWFAGMTLGITPVNLDADDYECWSLAADGYSYHGDTAEWTIGNPVVGLTVGPSHQCYRHADGTTTCAGTDDYGETDVPDGDFVALSAGYGHTCAITTDGFLACWGLHGTGMPTD